MLQERTIQELKEKKRIRKHSLAKQEEGQDQDEWTN